MTPTVLLVGTGGPLRHAVIRELVDRRVAVRVLVQEAAKAGCVSFSSLVEIVEGDLSVPSTVDAALAGIESVVLLPVLAPTQVVLHGSIVEAAERTGRSVHVVLVSPLGGVPLDPPLQFVRRHAVTEAQVRSAGLPLTVLHPQLLMQHLLRVVPSIRSEQRICGSFGSVRLPLIDGRDVAEVIATILPAPEGDERSVLLTGPQALSYPEIAATLSEELGRPIRYVDMPTEAYHEYLVGTGTVQWMADDLVTLARLFRNGHTWPVSAAVAEITGRPARALRQFVREHAAAFQPGAGGSGVEGERPCAAPLWLEEPLACPGTGAAEHTGSADGNRRGAGS